MKNRTFNIKRVCLQIGGMLFISLILAACSPGGLLGPTLTPTATHTPIPTNTPQPSQTPTPTISPTATNTPTITLTRAPTSIPKKVYYNQCNDPTVRVGKTIFAVGHLVVPAGRYDTQAESFTIWLRFKPDADARFEIIIPKGKGPNSMTLVPEIRDNDGKVLTWIKNQFGNQVFITEDKYNVIGTWQGNCVIQLEVILPE